MTVSVRIHGRKNRGRKKSGTDGTVPIFSENNWGTSPSVPGLFQAASQPARYYGRFVSSSSRGLASARESLCRGLGSRWFTERFHRNAHVTHFQHGQIFCTT